MRLAIMQPYLFPYIGYFQLMSSVDTFIIYDSVQYIQRGWMNRNRIDNNVFITIPVAKHSSRKLIKDVQLGENYLAQRQKIMNKIYAIYKKAPYFTEAYYRINNALPRYQTSLIHALQQTLTMVIKYTDIQTNIVYSSQCPIDHKLTGQEKILALCKYFKATEYINAPGGKALYKQEDFGDIRLKFLQPTLEFYEREKEFFLGLSIIDLMMYIDKDKLKQMIRR